MKSPLFASSLALLLGIAGLSPIQAVREAKAGAVEHSVYSVDIVNTDADPYWFGNATPLSAGESLEIDYTVLSKDVSSQTSAPSGPHLAVISSSAQGHLYPFAGNGAVVGCSYVDADAAFLSDSYFGVGLAYHLSLAPKDSTNASYTFSYSCGTSLLKSGELAFSSYFGIMSYPYDFTMSLQGVSIYSSAKDLGVYSFNGEKEYANAKTGCYHSSVTLTSSAHQLVAHSYLAPTETTEGNLPYYQCSGCLQYFSDSEGKNPIDAPSVILPKIVKHHHYQVQAVNEDADPYWFGNSAALTKGEVLSLHYQISALEKLAYTGVGEAFLNVVSNDGTGKLYPTTAKSAVSLEVDGKAVNKTDYPLLPERWFTLSKDYVFYFTPLSDGTNYLWSAFCDGNFLQSASLPFYGYFGVSIYPYNFHLTMDTQSYSNSADLALYSYNGGTAKYNSSVTELLFPEELNPMDLSSIRISGASLTENSDGYEGNNAALLSAEGSDCSLRFLLPSTTTRSAFSSVHVTLRMKIVGTTGSYSPLEVASESGMAFDSGFPENVWNLLSFETRLYPIESRVGIRLSLKGLSVGETIAFSDLLVSDSKALTVPLLGGNELYQLENTAPLMEGYVLKTKEGKILVIDGGDTLDAPTLYRAILALGGNCHVDGWFLSHFHCDHINALIALLNSYDLSVGTLYFDFPTDAELTSYSGGDSDGHCVDDLASALSAHGDKVSAIVTPKEGDIYTFGSVSMKVLNNAYKGAGNNYGNDTSIVYKLVTSQESVLFLGDLGERGDVYLGDSSFVSEIETCKIVQMAHHGQNGVTTKFYDACKAMMVCLFPAAQWIYDNNVGGAGFNSSSLKSLQTRAYLRERGIFYSFTCARGRVFIY